MRNAIGILSKEEGDWVQMVWDTLANIYPEVERIFEVQMGVLPEAIEPSNVEIGGVVRKGGYFPMMYNPDRMVPESKTSTAPEHPLCDPLRNRAGREENTSRQKSGRGIDQAYGSPVLQ